MINPFRKLLEACAWLMDKYRAGGEYFAQKKRLKDHQDMMKQSLNHALAVKRIKQRVEDMPYYPDGNIIRIKPADPVEADLDAIPGMKERTWARFNDLKASGRLGGGGACPHCNQIVSNLALHVARECKADFTGHIEDCFLKPDSTGIQHLEPPSSGGVRVRG